MGLLGRLKLKMHGNHNASRPLAASKSVVLEQHVGYLWAGQFWCVWFEFNADVLKISRFFWPLCSLECGNCVTLLAENSTLWTSYGLAQLWTISLILKHRFPKSQRHICKQIQLPKVIRSWQFCVCASFFNKKYQIPQLPFDVCYHLVVVSFFNCHPDPWGNDPIWLPHIFLDGVGGKKTPTSFGSFEHCYPLEVSHICWKFIFPIGN